MRALSLPTAGGPLQVSDLPKPDVGAGELLVRVRAASINPIDVRVSTGRYPWGKYDYPVVPGFDFAGVVEATGSDVTRFRPGDAVLGYWSARRFHRGSWADYVAVPESRFVVHKPDGLGFDLAAALPLAAVTALLSVNGALPLAGEPVLVVGAAGAVGGYAVQLAAAAGGTVVATGRPAHDGRLRGLGAAEVIDYTRRDVVAVVADAYPDGVAALIDLVNEPDALAGLSTVVRDGGRIASACFASDQEALAERGIAGSNVIASACDPALLTQVVDLVQAGELNIGYDELRPLHEVPQVVQEISSGASRKTVIDVAEPFGR